MRKIDLLRELQDLDSSLDVARGELEQRRVRLGDDTELAPLRQELEAARQRLRVLREKGRDLEWKLEDQTARRKAEEKKLYGGTIKNPKELTGLAMEVESSRQRVSALEDQVLLNMDALEEASATADAAARALDESERAWRSEQATLESECASLVRQEEELGARREQVAARIDPTTMRSYEVIRRTRGGLAVVVIEQRACQGCRISLSSSEVQRARTSADPVTCQSCGRMLYLPV